MYDKTDSKEELLKQLQMLVQQEKMSQEEADCIKIQEVLAFLNSPLGVRMKAAWLEKRLYREQPFVIARSAEELDKTWAGKREPVLIQGIIDAYFEEEKNLVLVDYKTDHIRFGEESRLVDLSHQFSKTKRITFYTEKLPAFGRGGFFWVYEKSFSF